MSSIITTFITIPLRAAAARAIRLRGRQTYVSAPNFKPTPRTSAVVPVTCLMLLPVLLLRLAVFFCLRVCALLLLTADPVTWFPSPMHARIPILRDLVSSRMWGVHRPPSSRRDSAGCRKEVVRIATLTVISIVDRRLRPGDTHGRA